MGIEMSIFYEWIVGREGYQTFGNIIDNDIAWILFYAFSCCGIISGISVIIANWYKAIHEDGIDDCKKKHFYVVSTIFFSITTLAFVFPIIELFIPIYRIEFLLTFAVLILVWAYALHVSGINVFKCNKDLFSIPKRYSKKNINKYEILSLLDIAEKSSKILVGRAKELSSLDRYHLDILCKTLKTSKEILIAYSEKKEQNEIGDKE